nr:hypothetical protein [Neobacillus sp. Marseille-Q6967]
MLIARKRESSDENIVKLVAYTIILYVSSLFVPFVVVASFQSMMYVSRSQWFFETPLSAYIGFMVGMLIIALTLTLYLIFRLRSNKRILKVIVGSLILLTIPVFIFTSTSYYYLDDKGIHYNNLTSLKEKEYKWEDVDTFHKVYRNHQGTTGYYQFKFEMVNGEMVTIPFSDKVRENQSKIEEVVNKFKIKVKDNFDNPITD